MNDYNCNRNITKVEKIYFYIKDFALVLIGVAGTLAGVMVTNNQNVENDKSAQIYTYQSKIIDQRIKLIDRAANIFGKSPGLQDTFKEYSNGLSKGEIEQPVIDKITDAQGEFQSVVFLASVYFGPKTQKALKDLSDINAPWWAKPKVLQDNLIMAMTTEIDYKIKLFRE
ncbi:hypothetical protein [Klebsiella aerogenes]|uniref:hypothetical protein n=1 Tax=Klebsiella aerogenes TaxID=548 RepID=UPI002278DA94|nr:hypothetical protein [Klebsiella aerogenes]MCY4767005.1 hypothetical protein [Klebsiella aerogenes]